MQEHHVVDEQTHGEQGQPSTEERGTADINVLAQEFGKVARSLQAHNDTADMLADVVSSAVRLIPGVDEASISVVTDRRTVTCQQPSSALPEQVDAVQTEVGQGPCLDAIFRQQTVRVPVMATESRWPRFARRAAELGAASMLSFQLFVQGDSLGALNLYARHPDAFDDESEQVGLLFASHAAVAFAEAQHVDQLTRAMETRDLIGQAKGMLMERYGITAPQAFSVLTRVSQNTNQKLRLVAAELTDTRKLTGLK